MKKISHLMIVVIGLLSFYSCQKKPVQPMDLFNQIDWSAQPNTLISKEKSEGWILLFDGTTFKGWHGYNDRGIPSCWAIEDGCLTMNGVGSAESTQDIVTDKVYRNFAFTVEYKLTTGANSGIIFQVKEDPKYKYSYETGPEFQVIDHENWPDHLEDWQINGANYAMYPPEERPYKPVGEWNQLMLVVKGNEVTQILNGKEVVKYVKYSDEWNKLRNSGKWTAFPDWGKYDEGNIALQNHGTKVFYRNVMIKELK